ncbi:MAG: hypothetical protein AABY22_30510 [Nanoarchaeota archaeon]
MNKVSSSFSLDKKTFIAWNAICEKLAINKSKLIENFIKEFVEKNNSMLDEKNR